MAQQLTTMNTEVYKSTNHIFSSELCRTINQCLEKTEHLMTEIDRIYHSSDHTENTNDRAEHSTQNTQHK